MSNTTPRNGNTRCRTPWPILNFALLVLLMRGLRESRTASHTSGSKAVPRRYARVLGCDQAGEVEQHFGLFPRGIVLHLAVDHHRAGAVGHGIDYFFGESNLRRIRREDAF